MSINACMLAIAARKESPPAPQCGEVAVVRKVVASGEVLGSEVVGETDGDMLGSDVVGDHECEGWDEGWCVCVEAVVVCACGVQVVVCVI